MTIGLAVNDAQIPLKQVTADCAIHQYSAQVNLTQAYELAGKETGQEAVYMFPVPEYSAIFAVDILVEQVILQGSVWQVVDSDKIVASVKAKNEAKQEYEQAKAQGKAR